MKVKIKEIKPKKAVIRFEEAKPYFINALRRTMLSELPKLAIDDVIIYDNTSPLFDEIIAHRLSLLPVPTDLSLLSYKDECVCKGKGCPNCTVRYTLSKEGQGTVYSGDLQPSEKTWAITENKIPIVRLYGDQRLILEVEAVLGKAKDHAKWQSIIAPSYRMDCDITFEKTKLNDVKDFVSKIPEGLVEIKAEQLVLKDELELPVFESYIEREKINFINVKRDVNNFTFYFETDGSLTTNDALYESAKILEDKYAEFVKQLKKLK
jgi:DNA-directed RNA polymerase subunit D